MLEIATITSKRQLTLPAKFVKKLNLSPGQKLAVTESNGRLVLTPQETVVEELAGSLNLPANWHGKNMDQIIDQAKQSYFNQPK